MPKTLQVLFDGFNFYYGLKSAGWKRYYWLDMLAFTNQLLNKNGYWDIQKVCYFTSKDHNNGKHARQWAWLNANLSLHPGKFEVIWGKYQMKEVKCTNCQFVMQKPEEKHTDVNIAIKLMNFAHQNQSDAIALVSGDNDLEPPLQFIKQNFPNKRVLIIYPPNRNQSKLGQYATDPTKHLLNFQSYFHHSLMAKEIQVDGKSFKIPVEWEPDYPI